MEQYVASVVASEVYGVWPLEALKAAAILARTYVLYKVEEGRKKSKLYHVTATIIDQQYSGHLENEKINDAVMSTKGQVLSWNGKPILAMYHICCGGISPSKCSGIDFDEFPYLKRIDLCHGCKKYQNYSWRLSYSVNELIAALKKNNNLNIIAIKKIKNITYNRSGALRRLIILVDVKEKKKIKTVELVLKNRDVRRLFNINLSSFSPYFTVIFDKKYNIELFGRGQGHHLGLCQRGMHGYIKDGKSHEEILLFYFPGVVVNEYIFS